MADCDCPDVVEWGPLHSCWLLRTATNSTVSSRVACVWFHTGSLCYFPPPTFCVWHRLPTWMGMISVPFKVTRAHPVFSQYGGHPSAWFSSTSERVNNSSLCVRTRWFDIVSFLSRSARVKRWYVARIIGTGKSIGRVAAWELCDIHAPHEAEL